MSRLFHFFTSPEPLGFFSTPYPAELDSSILLTSPSNIPVACISTCTPTSKPHKQPRVRTSITTTMLRLLKLARSSKMATMDSTAEKPSTISPRSSILRSRRKKGDSAIVIAGNQTPPTAMASRNKTQPALPALREDGESNSSVSLALTSSAAPSISSYHTAPSTPIRIPTFPVTDEELAKLEHLYRVATRHLEHADYETKLLDSNLRYVPTRKLEKVKESIKKPEKKPGEREYRKWKYQFARDMMKDYFKIVPPIMLEKARIMQRSFWVLKKVEELVSFSFSCCEFVYLTNKTHS